MLAQRLLRGVVAVGVLDDRARLGGKVALVVGGAGGLGRAAAADLARSGCAVELCDRDPERTAATVAELEALGARCHGEVLDARDPDALGPYLAEVAARHPGGIQVLVNVVGGTFLQPFNESSPRGWEALIRTNFTWLLHAVSLAVPLMEGTGGSIVNLTSIEGHRAAPGFAVYGAMKAAVESLTRTLAVELGPRGVRVNAIAPDHIATEGLAGISAESAAASVPPGAITPGRRAVVPLDREGGYEDIGNCVLFLASELSAFVTGTTLHPDGGTLASSGWWRWPGAGWLTHPPDDVLPGPTGRAEP